MTTYSHEFFGLAEDTIYYDERKKRFVSSKNAPEYVNRSMRHAHFKEVREYSLTSVSNVLTCMVNNAGNSK